MDDTDPWFLGYTLSDRPSVAFASVASYLFLSPLSCFAYHYREMEKRNAKLDFSKSRVKNGGKKTTFGSQRLVAINSLVTALELE